MSTQANKKDHHKTTELDKFTLGFELNVPWNEAKHTTHVPVNK